MAGSRSERLAPAIAPITRRTNMRFMVMVPANKDSEADVLPDAEMLERMGKFNEEMVKAGVMLADEGLQSTSKSARIRFTNKKPVVINEPFTESKELVT